LRQRGLFLIPEETSPPAVLSRAAEIARGLEAEAPPSSRGVVRVLSDPLANAVHRHLLAAANEAGPDDTVTLANARSKLKAGAPLSREEENLLLYDRETLESGVRFGDTAHPPAPRRLRARRPQPVKPAYVDLPSAA
jgi:membrane glycosyltransferase